VHRLYAAAGGWFWLPCPACAEHFGGHEAGDCSLVTRTVCRRCFTSFRCCGGVTVDGERWHLSYAAPPVLMAPAPEGDDRRMIVYLDPCMYVPQGATPEDRARDKVRILARLQEDADRLSQPGHPVVVGVPPWMQPTQSWLDG
jgi:hypothetical protein